MILTEFFETVTKSVDSLWFCADNHAEEALLEEALAWESEAILFVEELLAEVHIIRYIWESF